MKGKRTNYKQSRRSPQRRTRFYTKEDAFISRMASILMLPKSKIVPLFSLRATTTIRLNPLRGSVAKTKEALLEKGCDLENITMVENAYFVRNRDKNEMARMDEYEAGKFYIQNLSSMLPSIILNPETDDVVLDMCAAPGSKTTHLAALMNNKGKIIANDSDSKRISSLRNVISQFGVKNARVVERDGVEYGPEDPNSFNKVLLDAPCSGEGLLYLRGDKPLRAWGIDRIKRYSHIQKQLIESAFLTLKHGNSMIYSTCTLEPEENEGVVTHLLEKYPNARLETIEIEKNKNIVPGIPKWSGNKYHPTIKKSIRILPSSRMIGFYIAKIFKE